MSDQTITPALTRSTAAIEAVGACDDIPLPAMPSIPALPGSGPLVQRSSSRSYILALAYILYLLPFMRLLVRGTDEGLFVYGAVRIIHGEVFARDFFEIVGPGTQYWLAGFFKLFGVSFATARFSLFLTSLGTAVVMYWLSRRICPRYAYLPGIILAATAFGPIWPGTSHHVDSNFLALLSVACTLLWLDRHHSIMLFIAGVLTGATTVFFLPKGLLLLAAILLWLLVQRRNLQISRREIAWLLSGYGLIICVVLTYFWTRHALWDLAYANILFPLKHYAVVNSVPYGQGIIRDYWSRWAFSANIVRWTALPASVLIIPFLYVAALPGLLLVFGIWHKSSFPKPEITLFWICGWALWLAEYHRKDICHLVFGSTLLMILGIHYFGRSSGRVMSSALQILAISSACLAVLNLFVALTANTRVTRVGRIATFGDDPALNMLNGRVAPGEEILVYPSDPMYYFLSATVNPIRWGGLMYHYNSPAEFRDVIRVLDAHRVRYVLWNRDQEKAIWKVFPSATRPTPDELVVEPYLESHYTVIWEDAGTRIMERKGARDVR